MCVGQRWTDRAKRAESESRWSSSGRFFNWQQKGHEGGPKYTLFKLSNWTNGLPPFASFRSSAMLPTSLAKRWEALTSKLHVNDIYMYSSESGMFCKNIIKLKEKETELDYPKMMARSVAIPAMSHGICEQSRGNYVCECTRLRFWCR